MSGKRYKRTVRAQHGRRLKIVGRQGSAYPVRLIMSSVLGAPVAPGNRDYSIAIRRAQNGTADIFYEAPKYKLVAGRIRERGYK
jgi:hypothetical protein